MSTGRFDLAPFKTLIQQHCGLVFGSGNDEKLATALSERMERLAMGQPSVVAGRYLNWLLADAEEFQSLVNLLTINETYFFREQEQISLVVEHLLPRVLAEKSAMEPLRLLSAGCASGEEAYSLSIAIAERYGELVHSRCQIVGIDIDSEIIAKAQRGVYTAFSFRGLAAEFRQRYFQPGSEANSYRIQDKYRRQVSFFQGNLFAQPQDESMYSGLTPSFDIALMRNVSIYFDDDGRRQLQRALHRQLSSQGHLVVGSAETLANDLGIFRFVEQAGHYYFSKEALTLPIKPVSVTPTEALPEIALEVAPEVPMAIETQASVPSVQPADAPHTWQDISQMLERHKHHDAGLMLASLSPAQSATHPYKVLMAYLALEEGRLDEAGEIARQLLSDQPWFVDALIVQGLVARLQHRTEDAAACFRRVTYAQPACWPAHFHLAECGEPHLGREQRLRAYRNVLRLSESNDATGIDYLPTVQQRTQIRQLARQRLIQMADASVGSA